MTINELAKKTHQDAVDMGWYDDGKTKSDLEALMMVVSELSEAVEEIRKDRPAEYEGPGGKPEGWAVEIADAVIRLLDYSAYKGVDLERVIINKLEFNKTRGYRHGGKKY